MKCFLCEFEYDRPAQLSQHIRNKHKDITIQKYYDKFIKTVGEEHCQFCGNLNKFISINKGYTNFCSQTCGSRGSREKSKKSFFEKHGVENPFQLKRTRQLNVEVQHKKKAERDKKIKQERLDSIDPSDITQCQICGRKFESAPSVSKHVSRSHNMKIIDYYTKYFQKEGEGICKISGEQTSFQSLEYGFRNYKYGFNGKDERITHLGQFTRRVDLILNLKQIEIDKSIHVLNANDMLTKDGATIITYPIDILCLECGSIYKSSWMNISSPKERWGRCPSCYPKFSSKSQSELELIDFVRDNYSGKIIESFGGLITNPKTGNPFELDLYFPDLKIAIEFDGLYWHSEASGKDKDYHLIKTNLCKRKGVRLIHIFEDEWIHKKEIVKSRIKNIIGKYNTKINGRDCTIREIDPSIKNTFLDKNHIQGQDSSKIKLGAYYNNELVSVMTFSKGNVTRGGNPTNNQDVWELNRFCSKLEYHIPGIAGKFLSHFKKNYSWKEIYSYADRRWSEGNLYLKLGFNTFGYSQPQYSYVDSSRILRIHRSSMRKRPDESKDIPEWKIRLDEGYYRIWDCGVAKYILINS